MGQRGRPAQSGRHFYLGETQGRYPENSQQRSLVPSWKQEVATHPWQPEYGLDLYSCSPFQRQFFWLLCWVITNNKREGNQHLEGSLNQFRKFVKKEFLSPHDLTENLCERFRTFLLDKLTGKTPSDYFHAFKRVVKVLPNKVTSGIIQPKI